MEMPPLKIDNVNYRLATSQIVRQNQLLRVMQHAEARFFICYFVQVIHQIDIPLARFTS